MTNETIHPLKRLLRLLSGEKSSISIIYIYALFSGLVALSLPLGIQAIVNLVMAAQVSTSWVVLVIAVVAGLLVAGVINLLQLAVNEQLQQKIFVKAAFEFSYRMPRIRVENANEFYLPELANRFFDTLTIQKGLSKILVDFSSATIQVFFGLFILCFYHPFFIAFGFGLVLIISGILLITFKKGLETSLNESKHKYNVAHWLEELGRNQITFKMAGNSALPLENADKAVSQYLTYRSKHFRVLLIQGGLLVAFKVLISGGLLLLGSLLIIQNQINIGQFVAAEIIIILVLASVEKLIFSMEPLYDILTALEKIGSVTDLPLDDNASDLVIPEDMKNGHVEIKLTDVSYRFEGQNHDSLENVNLTFKPGEKWCITGMNGAGKSLLLQLISGMYENYEGSIHVNGYSMRDLDKNFFRQYTGIQFSREKIFEGTLIENISLGRSHIDMAAIKKALETTTLNEDMKSLSLSFQTHLMSEGKNLPKSTIQKILMARCIAGDPPLIIVEDNLHLWQPAAANDMMRYLLNSAATVILVTRRASVAKQFPNIALVENGKITHAGPNQITQS